VGAGLWGRRAAVRKDVRREARRALRWLDHAAAAERDPALPAPERGHLARALRQEARGCLERILALLAFISDAESITQAQRRLRSHDPERRAYAMELLDQTLSGAGLRSDVLPLLERLAGGSDEAGGGPGHAYGGRVPLEELAAAEPWELGAWTRSLALYLMGRAARPEYAPAAQRAMAGGPLAAETAAWALERIQRAA
jgi:hypothetical protein